MDDTEKKTVIEGFRLLGKYGREARLELQAAIDSGDIDADTANEALAQIEDISTPD